MECTEYMLDIQQNQKISLIGRPNLKRYQFLYVSNGQPFSLKDTQLMYDVCVSVKDHLTQFCQFIYKPNTKEKGMNIFDEGGGGGKSF